jgi:hypothetical protein
LSCLHSIPSEDVLRYLSGVRGYCYPFCRIVQLASAYFGLLQRDRIRGTFSDSMLNDDDRAFRCSIRDVALQYKCIKDVAISLYERIADFLRKRCRGAHRKYIKDIFTDQTFSLNNCRDVSTVSEVGNDASSTTHVLRELIAEESTKKRASRRTRKNCAHKVNNKRIKNTSLQKCDDACVHGSDTLVVCDDQEVKDLGESVASLNMAHKYERSQPIFSMFHHRVLVWHSDSERALREQGYNDSRLRKYTPVERERDAIVVKHRIPLIIEQYFRHLALPTVTKTTSDCKELHTLNFPGAIVEADGTYRTGIFAIGFDPVCNNLIYHRFFHVMKNDNDLQEAVKKGVSALNVASCGVDDQVLVEVPPTDDMTIMENDLMVSITDNFGVEYVLFKGHLFT